MQRIEHILYGVKKTFRERQSTLNIHLCREIALCGLDYRDLRRHLRFDSVNDLPLCLDIVVEDLEVELIAHEAFCEVVQC